MSDKKKAGKEANSAQSTKVSKAQVQTSKQTPPTKGKEKPTRATSAEPKKVDAAKKSQVPKGDRPTKAPSSNGKKGAQARRDIAGQRINAAEAVMAFGEVFSMEDAIKVAELDLKRGKVSRTKDYPQKNSWQYYLGINLWYLLVADLHRGTDPHARIARSLVGLIRSIGLIATIGLCCDAAQRLVQEAEPGDRVRFLISGDMYIDMQCLRFLKRFTVIDADIMQQDNIRTWLKIEKSTRSYNIRQWSGYSKYEFLMERIKALLAQWLINYKSVRCDLNLPVIPSGSTFELDKDKNSLSMAERARRYARVAHDGKRFLFNAADPKWETPIDRSRLLFDVDVDWVPVFADGAFCTPDGTLVLNPGKTPGTGEFLSGDRERFHQLHAQVRVWTAPAKRFNRLSAVPKTYKSYRTVAPESPLNQMMQRKIRDAVWDALPTWVKTRVPLHDQRIMEALAAAGRALNLSTTDASHASDSFSVRVFVDAFPSDVVRDVLRWRPTHTFVEGFDEDHVLQQLSTMGTGNVWLLMAVFLLACECVACDLGGVLPGRRNACFVFGDDMIHPSEVADILYWILDVMNFVVNKDKSYSGSAKYRESCGSEWWQESEDAPVISLRTLYYPRFPVSPTNIKKTRREYNVRTDDFELVDGLSRLIALQHSLYDVAPSAAEFLARAVRRLEPRMTTSLAHSQCDDLWGEFVDGPRKEVDEIVGNLLDKKGRLIKPPVWFDPELGLEVPANTRVGHMVLTQVKTADTSDPILQEWLYLQFLQEGPAALDLNGCLYGATQVRRLVDPKATALKWKLVF